MEKIMKKMDCYNGNDLGNTIKEGSTDFRVWSPDAKEMILNLYKTGNGKEAPVQYSMEKSEGGTWYVSIPEQLDGRYYTYSVRHDTDFAETTDPYAHAVSANGERSEVCDFAKLDSELGYDEKYIDNTENYMDAFIWEIHVRDFSNRGSYFKHPGKFTAFTEKGLVNAFGEKIGIDYLKELGVTHIHLLPVYDYGSVDETDCAEAFNWGYDPVNYNSLEGSYSEDPYDGKKRIKEFKALIKACHEEGIGVVMDVVYNHTYDIYSNLNKLVPEYYYRLDENGNYTNGSGCGNETASDHEMYRKFMIDSLVFWMQEYHLDGFRFDLMAVHDIDTMQEIEKRLHEINPKALIYGEGWNGGESALEPSKRASVYNIRKIKAHSKSGGIAVFNDVIRDGLKGSVFESKEQGVINGSDRKNDYEKVCSGLTGNLTEAENVWNTDSPLQVVNYMSAHDNLTLWDKLILSTGLASEIREEKEELMRMNKLGAAIVLLSRGIPFVQAGEEMLRTKSYDENSFRSSDEINNLNWDVLSPESDEKRMSDVYKALIRFRKAHGVITDMETKVESHTCSFNDKLIELSYENTKHKALKIYFNTSKESALSDIKCPEGYGEISVNSELEGIIKVFEAL